MRDDPERLRDIRRSIDRIFEKVRRGRAEFDANETLQVWVLHHLQIVGEAARCLSEEFRRQVLEEDLPSLRRRVQEILAVWGQE